MNRLLESKSEEFSKIIRKREMALRMCMLDEGLKKRGSQRLGYLGRSCGISTLFKQKTLGNAFDSSTKSLEDSRKVITFAGRTVKRNDNNGTKS